MNRKPLYLCRSLILMFISLPCTLAYAQSWDTVGQACFSAGQAIQSKMVLDRKGAPYVAYIDATHGDSVTVMKYDGSDWVLVGLPAFSIGAVISIDIAIDTANAPMVAFTDYSNGSKATVMKYDGAKWSVLGTPDFSANQTSDLSIAISAANTPYVVYNDTKGSRPGPATVMKYDGTDWVLVGTAGFSAGAITYPAITIDASGTPYVLFIDSANNHNTTVMKFDGANWATVGTPGFGAIINKYTPSILTDASGTPYVAFSSKISPYLATVMKYNGSTWVGVGSNASADQAHYTSMALDNSGTPYIAYEDWSESHLRATVRKYDGTKWTNVGNARFSADTVHFTDIAIDKNGTPYVSYFDAGPISGTFRSTVTRFRNSLGVKDINSVTANMSITPNPSQGLFSVNIPTTNQDNADITITDATGKVVKRLTVATNKDTTIDMDGAPTGVYIINATSGGTRWNGKLVVTP